MSLQYLKIGISQSCNIESNFCLEISKMKNLLKFNIGIDDGTSVHYNLKEFKDNYYYDF